MVPQNDINSGRYADAGCGMRFSDSDVDQPSDDSDSSAAPSRRKSGPKGGRVKGPKLRTLNRWTPDEHERLAYLVSKWGSEKNWAKVAEEMPGRTGKQCRERWLNHMKPGIIKGNWSFEEEFLLAQCHAVVGSHWSKMTKRLPGRTENSIKNFWNATLRSKAPHKRRGVLWLYMQQQTSQDGENIEAFLFAVGRLAEAQELPEPWSQFTQEGRLTDRTLRAILRAEKEFLENTDAELHPLSMPHPTHGLSGGSDTAPAGAPAAVRNASAKPAREPRVQPNTQPVLLDKGSATAAAALPADLRPASPLPATGLTPRFPGADMDSGHGAGHAAPGAAADIPAAVAGLCLPPEILAALHSHELWTSLPSCQGLMGPFNGAPGGMESMMPNLGLASDLRPSGAGGAFGGNAGNMLAAGGDAEWGSLPSFRGGLGGFTPHGVDPLKLLEPYGALHGHNSSSNSIQTRPESSLEFEPPAHGGHRTAGAAADSFDVSRDSSSRPGASHQQMAVGDDGAGMGLAHAHHQRQQAGPYEGLAGSAASASMHARMQFNGRSMSSGVMPRSQYSPAENVSGTASPTHDSVHPALHPAAPGAATGKAGQPHSSRAALHDRNSSQHSLQAAAGGYAAAWVDQCQQQRQHDGRSSSPGESETQSGLASAPAAMRRPVNGSQMTSGHGANCSCSLCSAHYQHGEYAHPHDSQGYNHCQAFMQDQHGSSPWHSPHRAALAAEHARIMAQHSISHQRHRGMPVYEGDHFAAQQYRGGPGGMHSSMPPPQHHPGAAMHADRMQQRGSADSSGARHAGSSWDAANSQHGASAAEGYSAAMHQHWQQQQQPYRQPAHPLQLPAVHNPAAAALFSPKGLESPTAASLQHLLDSATAQSGMSCQDIFAWLAAANAGHAPQQHQHRDWMEPELQAQQTAHTSRHAQRQGQMGALSAPDDSAYRCMMPPPSAAGYENPSYASSILETLLGGPHASAQLGDALLSPAGFSGTAALLQGSLPPTPAAGPAFSMLQATKRDRNIAPGQEDADLLIDQPASKLSRVF